VEFGFARGGYSIVFVFVGIPLLETASLRDGGNRNQYKRPEGRHELPKAAAHEVL
jgi:hypothetical protein